MALLPGVIDAGPIRLARWRPDHVEAMVAAVGRSFDELHRWMPWAATEPDVEVMRAVMADARRAFDADEWWTYVLVEPAGGSRPGAAPGRRLPSAPGSMAGPDSEGAVVGSAGLHSRIGPGGVDIGYWVRSDRTGRGYATAAAGALTDAAFRHLPGVDRVEIHMDRANRASAAIPPKLGFHLDREEPRPVLAPGHTGWGLVWTVGRHQWEPPWHRQPGDRQPGD